MKSITCIASLLLVCSAAVIAESPVDGDWVGEVTNGDAKQSIVMTLRSADTTLTGYMIGGGVETSIQDGTFAGTALEFKTVQREGTSELTVKCQGQLAGDSIAFTCKTEPETF